MEGVRSRTTSTVPAGRWARSASSRPSRRARSRARRSPTSVARWAISSSPVAVNMSMKDWHTSSTARSAQAPPESFSASWPWRKGSESMMSWPSKISAWCSPAFSRAASARSRVFSVKAATAAVSRACSASAPAEETWE